MSAAAGQPFLFPPNGPSGETFFSDARDLADGETFAKGFPVAVAGKRVPPSLRLRKVAPWLRGSHGETFYRLRTGATFSKRLPRRACRPERGRRGNLLRRGTAADSSAAGKPFFTSAFHPKRLPRHTAAAGKPSARMGDGETFPEWFPRRQWFPRGCHRSDVATFPNVSRRMRAP